MGDSSRRKKLSPETYGLPALFTLSIIPTRQLLSDEQLEAAELAEAIAPDHYESPQGIAITDQIQYMVPLSGEKANTRAIAIGLLITQFLANPTDVAIRAKIADDRCLGSEYLEALGGLAEKLYQFYIRLDGKSLDDDRGVLVFTNILEAQGEEGWHLNDPEKIYQLAIA